MEQKRLLNKKIQEEKKQKRINNMEKMMEIHMLALSKIIIFMEKEDMNILIAKTSMRENLNME